MNTIVINQIRCNLCGDELISQSVHDFHFCKCGAVAIDGGTSLLRRIGNIENYTEMSFLLPNKIIDQCVNTIKKANHTKRNEYETALSVLRTLREILPNELIVNPKK